MTLEKAEQVAAIFDLALLVEYRQECQDFMASFKRVEIKDGKFLRSACGFGKTPDAAAADYLEQIKGKRLVYDAMGDGRREFAIT